MSNSNTDKYPRPVSSVWGDETAAVDAAQNWARRHTALANDPKSTARQAESLAADVGATITEDGIGHAEAMRIFDEVLHPATRSADDPMNLAYIPGAPTRASVAFDFVVSAANVFGGIWEGGAGAIFAENQVLDWLMDLAGWPDGGAGCFVAGGTAGNLSALATARQRAKTRWEADGRYPNGRPPEGFAIACATSAHSSIRSNASLLDCEVVTVELNEQGRLSGDKLAPVLDEHPNVFAVVASGGTTNAGIVDDLASIVRVAHERGLWVHMDGAYGAAALAAPSVRHRFEGIEEVDSFIVDPHKWLFAPYDCCALLYRDPTFAYQAHAQHAEYLDQIVRTDVNPSDLAAHLSRRTRGLPLWYSLATHGTAKYTAAIERTLEICREVTDGIRAADHLEVVVEPQLSVVVFRRVGWGPEQYTAWSERLAHDGLMLCVPTKHEGETLLRLVFTNPDTDPGRVLELLNTTMD
ncbi:pyridoxal phosphate-dependent decarboxylase family protein [Helcobacillus massiliensis]|uniref:pyridoxal phosphate-dependent decarboxylase family protein n=1 Tax=Helcobacillus massiliensis TaxID=521392 RepID=UPI002557235C|nr:aminotransferase class V-fold PLP-dependent enzyme [Helcobacillus massiliensis]MDK7741582.1 aminotransferase class V-fold PLP-dependent enzyme [Helcobacillus massiliensis]WOO92628.1 aminotransferase class V-fold PLP-dependent enzyme [Helcobacillus massiliensis]